MRCLGIAIVAFITPGSIWAQGVEYVKANYTKFEYRIPMRDGKKLFTAVYMPKDDSKKYPILLSRTPYSCQPYGADRYPEFMGFSSLLSTKGYIYVRQDVRGCWMSEGEFVNMRPYIENKKGEEFDETSDTYDTIEWLIKNIPNNNGKVGQTGISYPGFYSVCGMIDAHPALKAVSPQAPINDWFVGDDFHHNGALFLPHLFNFISGFGTARPEPTKKREGGFDHGTPDGYDFFLNLGPLPNADAKYFKGKIAFWNEVMKHPTYDEFWRARNIRPHIKDIKPAVLTVGGWFDAENLFGALETFKNAEAKSLLKSNHLVMGPWTHGSWSHGDGDAIGNLHFGAKTAAYFREKIEVPFFEYYLKNEGKPEHPKAWVFETGTNRWRKFDAWPPKEAVAKDLFLLSHGKLSMQAPPPLSKGGTGGVASSSETFDEYVSDPSKPVPHLEKTTIGMSGDYMTVDQRYASRRPDVLVYQSPELTSDLSVAGPINVDLLASTSGTDSDWIVKLIDVYPTDYPDPKPNPTDIKMGGYQQMVRGEPMRGRFRNSYEKPEAFEPNQPTRIRYTMPDVCHTFRTGHRVMIQIHSSWFPLVDRNPQTFTDIYQAKPEDFKKATQRVYINGDTKVTIPVLP